MDIFWWERIMSYRARKHSFGRLKNAEVEQQRDGEHGLILTCVSMCLCVGGNTDAPVFLCFFVPCVSVCMSVGVKVVVDLLLGAVLLCACFTLGVTVIPVYGHSPPVFISIFCLPAALPAWPLSLLQRFIFLVDLGMFWAAPVIGAPTSFRHR